MAYTVLANPGSQHGPCKDECKHIDCNKTKQLALTLCPLCDEPLGYDRPLTNDPDTQNLGHFSCVEESIEKERAAG
jgi:hypothetical protein